MYESPGLKLPLLASNQAQKHVTMNEALLRLDAFVSSSVLSAERAAPPDTNAEGGAYILPADATGEWADHRGEVALWSNSGWIFLSPPEGWRAWVRDRGEALIFEGGAWRAEQGAPALNGASAGLQVISSDEVVPAGAAFETGIAIPEKAVVLGVTGRVTEELTGAGLTSWRIGVAGADDRYGKLIGVSRNSSLIGPTSSPVAYFAETPLTITADEGAFAGGVIRLAVHYFRLTPPDAV